MYKLFRLAEFHYLLAGLDACEQIERIMRELELDLQLRITANDKNEIQTVICGNEKRLKVGFEIF